MKLSQRSQEQKRNLGGGQFFIQKEKQNNTLTNLNKVDIDFIPYSQERNGKGQLASTFQTERSKKNKKYKFDKKLGIFGIFQPYLKKKEVSLIESDQDASQTSMVQQDYWNSKKPTQDTGAMIHEFKEKQSTVRKNLSSRAQSACFKSEKRKSVFPVKKDTPNTQYDTNVQPKKLQNVNFGVGRKMEEINAVFRPITDNLNVSDAFKSSKYQAKKCEYTINQQIARTNTKKQWWTSQPISSIQKSGTDLQNDRIKKIKGLVKQDQNFKNIGKKYQLNARSSIQANKTYTVLNLGQLNNKVKDIKHHYIRT